MATARSRVLLFLVLVGGGRSWRPVQLAHLVGGDVGAGRAVAGTAGDVVALAAKRQELGRHRERNGRHEVRQRLAVELYRAVWQAARREGRVLRDALARNGARGRRLHPLPVGVEGALA